MVRRGMSGLFPVALKTGNTQFQEVFPNKADIRNIASTPGPEALKP